MQLKVVINSAVHVIFAIWCIGYSTLKAQVPEPMGTAAIFQQMQKLKVVGSVLYVAAHPDDENNSLLPYLAKEKKYRTAYLSLTRGDGGQNLIGSEQGIDLGLIRTQELLAARKIDGSEQYFTSAYEFGFSKTSSETLSIWDKQKVLADMVWVIRKFQPDIIINRFPPDARAGHGHHASSAILSAEAFKAAGDPNQFPDQLKKGVGVWQAKRLLWNTFNFGGANTTSENQLKINAGVFNPFLGQSYGEVGGEARSMHKSQGEGRPRRKGPIYEYFVTVAGDSSVNQLMDGIITDWSRFGNPGKMIEQQLDKIIRDFQFLKPENSVKALVDVYRQVSILSMNAAWKEQKLMELTHLIAACAGLVAEATTEMEYAIPGEKMGIQFLVNKRSDANIELKQIHLKSHGKTAYDSSVNISLLNNTNYNINYQYTVPVNQPLSQPYWLESPMKDMGTFNVTDQHLIGLANSAPDFEVNFSFEIYGEKFLLRSPLQYKYVDLVRGELYEPLNVIPPVLVSLNKRVVFSNLMTPDKQKIQQPDILLQFKSNFTASAVPLKLGVKDESNQLFFKDTVYNLVAGNIYPFTVSLSDVIKKKKNNTITGEVQLVRNGQSFSFDQQLKTIHYDHIPAINYLYKDQIQLIDEPIFSTPKKVGYIIGAGDRVPEALMQLGHTVEFLQEADLVASKLSQFSAIVVGIRAYNIHEWLTNKNDVLNKYIENGGHLIVQYLKNNLVGNKRVKVGPFDFSVSNVRVTEEKAKVEFLNTQHPFMNFPNKLRDKDFDNWIQERSTYQIEPVKAPYETFFQIKDTNDAPTKGSLVTASYGKGHFTYVSLVLFRQLPAGVSGSYKLLANLIAATGNK
ncbi:PIG-L family deacetylase [Sediminibacterium sp. TEGAF015]|uniref:PIG-L family deacetylase n=1 Tax=Sediminibacterium sp. TEGAF015 TaxID=575378 RepID=UPI00220EBB10|nr:PIG-L family deacetylase [Sediminibacterium sp. TEGAF015]BDQ11814.1 hypothetical protein TEGAF0_10310 [Sediminibacterium sp. TEGAF015]